MSLVESSEPGAVKRHELTPAGGARGAHPPRRELLDGAGHPPNRRAKAELFLLFQWVGGNLPECLRGEPCPADGIDQMVVPEGYDKLLEEIRVARAYFMYLMADSTADKEKIPHLLASYWNQHGASVPVAWF